MIFAVKILVDLADGFCYIDVQNSLNGQSETNLPNAVMKTETLILMED